MSTTRRDTYDGLLPQSGEYAVGFERRWFQDRSRSYAPRFVQAGVASPPKRFRPILMACWFPIAADTNTAMPYSDYFEPGNAENDPEFAEIAQRLFSYYREERCEFALGKPLSELSDTERQILENSGAMPTSVRTGVPLPGPFPLVVYHPGLGSAYFENAVLCEYLASHGYVVVSGAYFPADVDKLILRGDYERSNRDIAFLIERASELPNVDGEHIGLIGHSYGGHAVSVFQSERASVVDAVVSIDSTMELRIPSESPWFDSAKTRLDRVENLSVPMLLIAGRGIIVQPNENRTGENRSQTWAPRFDAYADLKHAERWYATIAHLAHFEFSSSGVLYNGIREPIWDNSPDKETAWLTYRLLNRLILQFLNASLKADTLALNELQQQISPTPPEPYDNLDSPSLVLQHQSGIPLG